MSVVLYIVFSYALFLYMHIRSFLFSVCESAGCTCVIRYIWSLCVYKLLLVSFCTPLTTSCCRAWGNQYWCYIRTGGDKGATGEIRQTVESVKVVSVYLSFLNNKIEVMVSNKCYDNFDYISIMNLQSTA